ncbi:MAG: class I SAM-dependent methyltransferase [Candidatus Lokiarchaeota archaeon]|nr:class I SAM-dependent methyltransferase [Candidatus Lokiarchaeota archaeon]
MKCLICGENKNIVPFLKKGEFIYFKCRNCSFIFQNLENRSSVLQEVYNTKENFSSYFNNYKTYVTHFIRILKTIERFKKTGKILDIGSGIGLFLYIAKIRNWQEYGIEISNFASNFALKKLKLNVSNTNNLSTFPDNYFDVIILNHVLEHIETPLVILNSVEKKLKGDGLLFIGVPNIYGILPKFMKDDWNLLQPYQHIYQFTPKSLKLLLRKFGFKPVNLHTENRVFGFKINFLNFILNTFLNPIINGLKVGEAMEVVFIKE